MLVKCGTGFVNPYYVTRVNKNPPLKLSTHTVWYTTVWCDELVMHCNFPNRKSMNDGTRRFVARVNAVMRNHDLAIDKACKPKE